MRRPQNLKSIFHFFWKLFKPAFISTGCQTLKLVLNSSTWTSNDFCCCYFFTTDEFCILEYLQGISKVYLFQVKAPFITNLNHSRKNNSKNKDSFWTQISSFNGLLKWDDTRSSIVKSKCKIDSNFVAILIEYLKFKYWTLHKVQTLPNYKFLYS